MANATRWNGARGVWATSALALLLLAVGCGSGGGGDSEPAPAASGAQIVVGDLPTERAGHGGGNVYAPDIMVDGALWRMWYGGQGSDGHDRIHYAESPDGTTWTKRGVVLDCGASNHVNDPSVVRAGSLWFMYYTDAAVGIEDRIHVAVSEDGLSWVKRGLVIGAGAYPWMTRFVGRPSVDYDGSIFRMWFDALSLDPALPYRYVAYATSLDGFAWTIHPNPVCWGGAVDVKRTNDGWRMLLEGRDGIYLATSADGIAWSSPTLWLPRSGEAYDAYGRVTPCAVGDRVYFGGAQAATWDNNAICVVVPGP